MFHVQPETDNKRVQNHCLIFQFWCKVKSHLISGKRCDTNLLHKDCWAQNINSTLCFASHWHEETRKNDLILTAISTLCLHHILIQKLLSPLRAKPPSRCMKSILIIINPHLNLIVRLPISLFKMSQSYAFDFSSLLNSSQYLLPKRFQSSAFSSVLSICAYTSTPAPWHHLVHRSLIIPLNQIFMRPRNKLCDIFFSNQRLVTKYFCCYWSLFLQVWQKKRDFSPLVLLEHHQQQGSRISLSIKYIQSSQLVKRWY